MAPLSKADLEELVRIQERVNSLFEQALTLGCFDDLDEGLPGTWRPAVDVLETPGGYRLTAELPGVDREDVELSVEGRQVVLNGRRRRLAESSRLLRMERSYGRFHRSVELGEEVDLDGVEARFVRGLLEIHLPKRSGASIEVVEEEGD